MDMFLLLDGNLRYADVIHLLDASGDVVQQARSYTLARFSV